MANDKKEKNLLLNQIHELEDAETQLSKAYDRKGRKIANKKFIDSVEKSVKLGLIDSSDFDVSKFDEYDQN